MKRGRSTGVPTLAEAARFEAIKELGCLVAVPSKPYYMASPHGDVYSTHPNNRWRGKIVRLKPSDNGRGYLRVSINKRLTVVHSIIAEAFIGPRPSDKEVNHKDGNKQNNSWQNLEYVSRSENMKHAHDTGLRVNRGREAHHMAVLSDQQVLALKAEYLSICVNGRLPNGEAKRLAAKYGVSEDFPRLVAKGKTRKLCNDLP